MIKDLSKILINETEIAERVQVLGAEITSYYTGNRVEELTLICVTNGAICFTADLMRQLNIPLRLDCIRVSSYLDTTKSVMDPQIIETFKLDVTDRHVLIVDDIIDSGKTFQKLINLLNTKRPASLKTCALLNKKERREVDLKADFVGFDIPDEFVIGYGLDFANRYRNLPCIGVLRPELQNPPEWE